MSILLAVLLFGTAFAASVWTLYVSVKPQLHRYHALFAPAATLGELPLRASRVTVRWSPAQPVSRLRLREAA